MSAAIAALTTELAPERIDAVNDRGDRLRTRLNDLFLSAEAPIWVTGVGSMLCLHSSDDRLIELLFHAALADGLYIARRGFMALSMDISDDHCDRLVATVSSWLG